MRNKSKRSPALIAGLIFSFFITFALITGTLTVYVYYITEGITAKFNMSQEWQGHWKFLMCVLCIAICVRTVCKLFDEADKEHQAELKRRELLKKSGRIK